MKSKKLNKTGVIVIIAFALLLLVPIPMPYDDGGTVEYCAVLYSVINYHTINGDGYDTGIGIKVLGMMIYENKTFTQGSTK